MTGVRLRLRRRLRHRRQLHHRQLLPEQATLHQLLHGGLDWHRCLVGRPRLLRQGLLLLLRLDLLRRGIQVSMMREESCSNRAP